MSAGPLKVGTMVLVIEGSATGRVGRVAAHRHHVAHGMVYDHSVVFPSLVPVYRGGVMTQDTHALCPRRCLVPLTPPGEPETLIESTPVRDEVTA